MNPSHPGSGAGHPGSIDGALTSCWLCQRAVSARALFCHACGAIQPPRPLDPFARLGLERRFDIDPAVLERQYRGFSRALDPQRFASRGVGENHNARAQAEAFAKAYEELKDPVARARCLLLQSGVAEVALAALAPADCGFAEPDPAADTATLDGFAVQVSQDIAAAIHQLSAAFRADDLAQAGQLVLRLECLTRLAEQTRARRAVSRPLSDD